MADDFLKHIFIKDKPTEINYSGIPSPFEKPIPTRNRKTHGEFLKNKFESLWDLYEKQNEDRKTISLPTKEGIYLEFIGKEGFELATNSLESFSKGVRLLNIHSEGEDAITTKATIFIPHTQKKFFLKKVTDYLNKNRGEDKPANQRLINGIEEIRLAVLESFWQDSIELLPKENPIWCEIWLITDNTLESANEKCKNLFELCDFYDINHSQNYLIFPERVVILIEANKSQLLELIESSANISEFRLAQETASFWTEMDNIEQLEWAEELKNKLNLDPDSNIFITILDAGVNNGHILLNEILSDKNCQSLNSEWGTTDNDIHFGHGTLMSGIAAYGDLTKILKSSIEHNIRHKLESVKILPPLGENPPELYGDFTKRAISLAEINNPSANRIICMAVSSKHQMDKGRPSSWSSAIDDITSGANDDIQRLFLIAAGNIAEDSIKNYPTDNLKTSIESPGQSWNAITVGAYTSKIQINEQKYKGYKTLASAGELSPFSTTSYPWDMYKWPIKPEIVMEGGNIAVAPDSQYSSHEDLSLLSLSYQPTKNQFQYFNQTSAATAEASNFAAKLFADYPNAWPETIRGLIIHSASWNERMYLQFSINKNKKEDLHKLLRIFGYGVPDYEIARKCLTNSLTLIIEEEIQPFDKINGAYQTKDMHLFNLPWPSEELSSLGEKEVSIRLTLSYFIEPGPLGVGWNYRYRYASHALRFDLKTPTESNDDFIKRINNAAREKGEKGFTSNKWLIGEKRNVGSIHSDMWTGTGAEAASCNLVAVFPIIGWWKERSNLNCYNNKTRYSLIITIQTEETEVDLYTPIITKVSVPIEIKT